MVNFSTQLFNTLLEIEESHENLGKGLEFEFNVVNILSNSLKECNIEQIDKDIFIKNNPEIYRQLVIGCNNKDDKGKFDLKIKTRKRKFGNYLIFQPMGEMSWPDVFIIYNKKVIPIEIKTNQSTSIMFGGCPPVPGCIYIYSHKKGNNYKKSFCVFFMGNEIITPKERIKYFSRKIPEKASLSSNFVLCNYVRTCYSIVGTRKLFENRNILIDNIKKYLEEIK